MAEGDSSAQVEVATHYDYAGPLEEVHDPIMTTDVYQDRGRYRSQLNRYLEEVKERAKKEEADEKLAKRAYLLGRQYLRVIDEWDDRQEELNRIRNEPGLLKTADEEKARLELEERIDRKSKNLSNRWDTELEPWRYESTRDLATVKEWQGRLDRAIEAGLVHVRDAKPERTAPVATAPPPKAPEKAAPKPLPLPEPEPELDVSKFTFTMPSMSSKMSDNVKTPDHLLDPVTRTAGWLEMQQRRLGGKLASRISADQETRKVVLNLQVTTLYTDQTVDLKKRFAESLQQFWATTCTSTGRISEKSQAHVLLYDAKGKLIALSSDTNGVVIKVVN